MSVSGSSPSPPMTKPPSKPASSPSPSPSGNSGANNSNRSQGNASPRPSGGENNSPARSGPESRGNSNTPANNNTTGPTTRESTGPAETPSPSTRPGGGNTPNNRSETAAPSTDRPASGDAPASRTAAEQARNNFQAGQRLNNRPGNDVPPNDTNAGTTPNRPAELTEARPSTRPLQSTTSTTLAEAAQPTTSPETEASSTSSASRETGSTGSQTTVDASSGTSIPTEAVGSPHIHTAMTEEAQMLGIAIQAGETPEGLEQRIQDAKNSLATDLNLPANVSAAYLAKARELRDNPNANPADLQTVLSDTTAARNERASMLAVQEVIDTSLTPAGITLEQPVYPGDDASNIQKNAFRLGMDNWQSATPEQISQRVATLSGRTGEEVQSANYATNVNRSLDFLARNPEQSQLSEAQVSEYRQQVADGTFDHNNLVKAYANYYGMDASTATWSDVYEQWRGNQSPEVMAARNIPPSNGAFAAQQLKSTLERQLRLSPPGEASQAVPPSTAGPPVNGSGSPRIAVIDRFDIAGGMTMDGDETADASHGEVVSRFIQEQVPNARIEPVDIATNGNILGIFTEMGNQIQADLAAGRPSIQAVNISQETLLSDPQTHSTVNDENGKPRPNSIADLSRVTGLEITPENIGDAEMRQQIRARLDEMYNNPPAADTAGLNSEAQFLRYNYTEWVPYIQALEGITSQGVPIYMSAGNHGGDQINMFTLADGVITIAAGDANQQLLPGFTNNGLVDRVAQGAFDVQPVFDANNGQLLGVDYTGDGTLDLPADRLSSLEGMTPGQAINGIAGSSFASPLSLAEDFRRRAEAANPTPQGTPPNPSPETSQVESLPSPPVRDFGQNPPWEFGEPTIPGASEPETSSTVPVSNFGRDSALAFQQLVMTDPLKAMEANISLSPPELRDQQAVLNNVFGFAEADLAFIDHNPTDGVVSREELSAVLPEENVNRFMQVLDINNDGNIDAVEQSAYLLFQENPNAMLTTHFTLQHEALSQEQIQQFQAQVRPLLSQVPVNNLWQVTPENRQMVEEVMQRMPEYSRQVIADTIEWQRLQNEYERFRASQPQQ